MLHAAASPSRVTAPGGSAGQRVALHKHEAAGNDFLVLVDPAAPWAPSVAFVQAACDRRRGIGADGLLVVRPATGDADLEMALLNADGSRAEMSGNGIRCLVQAAVMAGLAEPGNVRVRTDAGLRMVAYEGADGVGSASVEMGQVTLGEELDSPVPGARARRAGVGNPHVVVVVGADAGGAGAAGVHGTNDVDLSSIDLPELAGRVTALVGEPVNVEVVRAVADDVLALRVFERGVGETAACGTGSCAAAAAARAWGLVGDDVPVANPGGTLDVHLDGAGGAVLAGPVRRIAEVRVPLPRPVTAAR